MIPFDGADCLCLSPTMLRHRMNARPGPRISGVSTLDCVAAPHRKAGRGRAQDYDCRAMAAIIRLPLAAAPMAFVPGQRWISNAEPELGLGTVVRLDGRTVQVLFATAGVLRQYAMQAAPLTRAEFRVGQKVAGQKRSFVIERISALDGMLTYHGGDVALPEAELDDTQPISRADERLLSARVDAPDRFDFRLQALARRAAAMRSPAWGLAAARIDLIPHQLRVAAIVAQRRPPRALLADEVGLGKTIEAGMVLARLLASGRVARVLVVAPASLTAQWFVELLRRFNLPFALFDEERCEAIEVGDDTRNPF